jgi:hypothetical protein
MSANHPRTNFASRPIADTAPKAMVEQCEGNQERESVPPFFFWGAHCGYDGPWSDDNACPKPRRCR